MVCLGVGCVEGWPPDAVKPGTNDPVPWIFFEPCLWLGVGSADVTGFDSSRIGSSSVGSSKAGASKGM